MATTIQVSERLKKRLLKRKTSPRQTYEEVIEKALDLMDEDDAPLSADSRRKVARARRQAAAGDGLSTEELLRELGL